MKYLPKNIKKIFGIDLIKIALGIAGFVGGSDDYGLRKTIYYKGQYQLSKVFSCAVYPSIKIGGRDKEIMISRYCGGGSSQPAEIKFFFKGFELGTLGAYGWVWRSRW